MGNQAKQLIERVRIAFEVVRTFYRNLRYLIVLEDRKWKSGKWKGDM